MVMVVHICHLSGQEAEAGELLQVQSWPGPQSKALSQTNERNFGNCKLYF